MILIPHTPAKSLHPAYRAQNVERSAIERFKTELKLLLQHLAHAPAEHEEHYKNILADFLKNSFYREEHHINPKEESRTGYSQWPHGQKLGMFSDN